jgi:hypothetical protein
MTDNERGYHHRHAIDKGITRGLHDLNRVPCPEMPGGVTGAPMDPDPHARGFKMPVHIAPETRRPVGEPTAMSPPHNPNPHPYNPSSGVKLPNTYGTVRR